MYAINYIVHQRLATQSKRSETPKPWYKQKKMTYSQKNFCQSTKLIKSTAFRAHTATTINYIDAFRRTISDLYRRRALNMFGQIFFSVVVGFSAGTMYVIVVIHNILKFVLITSVLCD